MNCDPNSSVAELDALQSRLSGMKRLQAETAVKNTGQAAAELDALLPAILPSSPGFDATGARAFIRLHPISARREGEL